MAELGECGRIALGQLVTAEAEQPRGHTGVEQVQLRLCRCARGERLSPGRESSHEEHRFEESGVALGRGGVELGRPGRTVDVEHLSALAGEDVK